MFSFTHSPTMLQLECYKFSYWNAMRLGTCSPAAHAGGSCNQGNSDFPISRSTPPPHPLNKVQTHDTGIQRNVSIASSWEWLPLPCDSRWYPGIHHHQPLSPSPSPSPSPTLPTQPFHLLEYQWREGNYKQTNFQRSCAPCVKFMTEVTSMTTTTITIIPYSVTQHDIWSFCFERKFHS